MLAQGVTVLHPRLAVRDLALPAFQTVQTHANAIFGDAFRYVNDVFPNRRGDRRRCGYGDFFDIPATVEISIAKAPGRWSARSVVRVFAAISWRVRVGLETGQLNPRQVSDNVTQAELLDLLVMP